MNALNRNALNLIVDDLTPSHRHDKPTNQRQFIRIRHRWATIVAFTILHEARPATVAWSQHMSAHSLQRVQMLFSELRVLAARSRARGAGANISGQRWSGPPC